MGGPAVVAPAAKRARVEGLGGPLRGLHPEAAGPGARHPGEAARARRGRRGAGACRGRGRARQVLEARAGGHR
eukprot:946377-Lingulodinium_polyedra.AAC.1